MPVSQRPCSALSRRVCTDHIRLGPRPCHLFVWGARQLRAMSQALRFDSKVHPELKALDTSGDRMIDQNELAAFLKLKDEQAKMMTFLQRAVMVLSALLLITMAASAGLTFKIVQDSKETTLDRNVLVSNEGSLSPVSAGEMGTVVPAGLLPYIAAYSPFTAAKFAPKFLPIVEKDSEDASEYLISGMTIVKASLTADYLDRLISQQDLNGTGAVPTVHLTTASGEKIVIKNHADGTLTRADRSEFKFCAACTPVHLKSVDTTSAAFKRAELKFNKVATAEGFRNTSCDPDNSIGFQLATHIYHTCHTNDDPEYHAIKDAMPMACSVAELQTISDELLPLGDNVCHPASSTMIVEGKGQTRLDQIKLGDMVMTPRGFEPIIGFAHADSTGASKFVSLSTEGGSEIRISADHWLPVNGVIADPVDARVGDVLTTVRGPEKITSARFVTDVGMFHVFVPGGNYYVDQVVAATYCGVGGAMPTWVWDLFGTKYVHLRFMLGIPIAPVTGAEGQLGLDFVAQYYVKTAPKAVVWGLFPVTALTAIAAELFNAVMQASIFESASDGSASTATVAACMLAAAVCKARKNRV